MTLFRNLNRDQGITVVVVTHATDIAAWSNRIVTFRDGLIIDDRPTREAFPGSAGGAGAPDLERQEASS